MNEWTSEAGVETFEEEVIDQSFDTPVIVDFWAQWCGPCRALTPTLETCVKERKGGVRLVKVNVDEAPELASKFGIRGIPAVKAFVKGEVVDEFVGAKDKRSVDAFLDDLIPNEDKQALASAEDLITQGRSDEAVALLTPLRDDPESREQASLLMAKAKTMTGRYEEAREILDGMPEETPLRASVDALRCRISLLEASQQACENELRRDLDTLPDDSPARYALAGLLFSKGRYRESLDELIELLKRDRKFDDDAARRSILAIFEELGDGHELIREYRRKLQIFL